MKKINGTFELPDFLTPEQKSDIVSAIKEGIPILVDGPQGPTGKTTLVTLLQDNGVQAYEKWECQTIVLNKFIKYQKHDRKENRKYRAEALYKCLRETYVDYREAKKTLEMVYAFVERDQSLLTRPYQE
ncbi:hypothetical protein [Listeria booriae]|uniref:hypothetical protein n=1 Tax=Listeria booriae TaxID=1552123 RepID=UPI001C8CC7A7|nr:hypothetical protein [Listeria booriae]